jgi:hypothetical protein
MTTVKVTVRAVAMGSLAMAARAHLAAGRTTRSPAVVDLLNGPMSSSSTAISTVMVGEAERDAVRNDGGWPLYLQRFGDLLKAE